MPEWLLPALRGLMLSSQQPQRQGEAGSVRDADNGDYVNESGVINTEEAVANATLASQTRESGVHTPPR